MNGNGVCRKKKTNHFTHTFYFTGGVATFLIFWGTIQYVEKGKATSQKSFAVYFLYSSI